MFLALKLILLCGGLAVEGEGERPSESSPSQCCATVRRPSVRRRQQASVVRT